MLRGSTMGAKRGRVASREQPSAKPTTPTASSARTAAAAGSAAPSGRRHAAVLALGADSAQLLASPALLLR